MSYWKKYLVIENDWFSVTELNHFVRYICHAVYSFFELPNIFHDFCLFNMSDQSFLGYVLSCFGFNNYKNITMYYIVTVKQNLSDKEALKWQKKVSRHKFSNGVCITVRYYYKLVEADKKNGFRLPSGLWNQIMEIEARQTEQNFDMGGLFWKSNSIRHRSIFSYFDFRFQEKWRAHVSYCRSYCEPQKADTTSKKVGERLKQITTNMKIISVWIGALDFCKTNFQACDRFLTLWKTVGSIHWQKLISKITHLINENLEKNLWYQIKLHSLAVRTHLCDFSFQSVARLIFQVLFSLTLKVNVSFIVYSIVSTATLGSLLFPLKCWLN